MSRYDIFLFKSYAFAPDSGQLTMRYAFADGPAFEEIITFPDAATAYAALPAPHREALDRAFRLLFLMAGVSYYKAAIPPSLVCEAFDLDPQTAAFCQKVYEGGLGEFTFRNKVRLNLRFLTRDTTQSVIASDRQVARQSTDAENMDRHVGLQPPRDDALGLNLSPNPTVDRLPLGLAHRALVPVGGGKDSIVTIEALRKAGKSFSLFALGSGGKLAEPIERTIAVAQKDAIAVKRVLSPALIALNKEDGILNGHVPITAILSCIAVACAILYNYDAVILSNERSANAPNLVHEGREVNHQYSKSFAFEQDLATYVRQRIAPDLSYFSLLRPLSETAIAQRFAQAAGYHDVFRSCNASFRQDETKRARHWCCDCPKCRFVFLALAPFMEKEKLSSIFGSNMLDDPAQEEGYAALCGLGAYKPFECVGEVEESALLMQKLAQMAAWQKDCIVEKLAPRLSTMCPAPQATFDSLMALSPEHLIPEAYRDALD